MTSQVFGPEAKRQGAISAHSTGLALGYLLGGMHLQRALLVASGFAQPVIDFIFRLYFLRPVYLIGGFGVRYGAGGRIGRADRLDRLRQRRLRNPVEQRAPCVALS
jgi:hypothetical protein